MKALSKNEAVASLTTLVQDLQDRLATVDARHERIYSAQPPKCGGRGRTWDVCTIKTPYGDMDGYYDSTWGKWVSFQYRGVWLKVSMFHPKVDNMKHTTIDLTEELRARKSRK